MIVNLLIMFNSCIAGVLIGQGINRKTKGECALDLTLGFLILVAIAVAINIGSKSSLVLY